MRAIAAFLTLIVRYHTAVAAQNKIASTAAYCALQAARVSDLYSHR